MSDACLASFQTDVQGWRCDDSDLQQSDSLVCGKTSHFSVFAIIAPSEAERTRAAERETPIGGPEDDNCCNFIEGIEDLYFFIGCGVAGW